jgi:peptide/nickel transport system permease protein
MARFLVQRLSIAILVMITVSIIGFSLLRLSGDLAAELAGEDASPEDIRRTAEAYGLDRPLYEQYFVWVTSALQGDLGRSLFTNEPVAELITDRIGITVKVAVFALILSLLVSVPLGVLAAIRPNTWIDRIALAIAVLGQAIPIFWLGLIMIYVFGVLLRWTPIAGTETWAGYILPVITLAVAVMPPFMRLTRTGMLEVLESDYIRTAWAKGLAPMSVLFKHALRNAILPVVSLSAVSLGFLLGGSVIVETVFALNGIGFLAFNSIIRTDFPVVQSILVFVSICYVVLTLLSDLINAQLDPRIRLN